MAYKTKIGEDWKGPFPNKAGEFCGNASLEGLVLASDKKTVLSTRIRGKVDNLRIGKPSSCPAGTSEEMAARGNVGLYAIRDEPLEDGAVAVDTDELMEDVVTGKKSASKPFVLEDWI